MRGDEISLEAFEAKQHYDRVGISLSLSGLNECFSSGPEGRKYEYCPKCGSGVFWLVDSDRGLVCLDCEYAGSFVREDDS